MKAAKNGSKKGCQDDARLLRRMASEIERKNVGVRSPFWKHVVRPRIEQGLQRNDKSLLTKLKRLDHRELDAEGLARILRDLAEEKRALAG